MQLKPSARLGMTGHNALMNHPFFGGVNWDRVRTQEEPVPAYKVVYDPEDPAKVQSFSLVNSDANFALQNVCNSRIVDLTPPRNVPQSGELSTADATLKSVKAF